MTSEAQESRIRALREMMSTLGWLIFVREHGETAEDMRRTALDRVRTTDQLHYLRGWVEAVESIVNYEKVVDAAEQQLQFDLLSDEGSQ